MQKYGYHSPTQQCFPIFLALRIPHNVSRAPSLKVSHNADPLDATRGMIES